MQDRLLPPPSKLDFGLESASTGRTASSLRLLVLFLSPVHDHLASGTYGATARYCRDKAAGDFSLYATDSSEATPRSNHLRFCLR